jgi:hypothetical protein
MVTSQGMTANEGVNRHQIPADGSLDTPDIGDQSVLGANLGNLSYQARHQANRSSHDYHLGLGHARLQFGGRPVDSPASEGLIQARLPTANANHFFRQSALP